MRAEVGALIRQTWYSLKWMSSFSEFLTPNCISLQQIISMGPTSFSVSWAILVKNLWFRRMETEEQN